MRKESCIFIQANKEIGESKMYKINLNTPDAKSEKQASYALTLLRKEIDEIEIRLENTNESVKEAGQKAVDEFIETTDAGQIIELLKEQRLIALISPLFKKYVEN